MATGFSVSVGHAEHIANALELNRERRAAVQLRKRLAALCTEWEKTDPVKVVILRELLKSTE